MPDIETLGILTINCNALETNTSWEIDATEKCCTHTGRMECLQQKDIITPLGIGETAEWCNSFLLMPKLNMKVRLSLDPARLNQVLIRLVHRAPILNDIFPKLSNVQYLFLIDPSSGYHNLN